MYPRAERFVRAGHALAEMLIDSAVYAKSLEPWKVGEEVKMWFADASGEGGGFYHGTVVGQTLGDNGDAWDSVTVRWNDDEEMQVSACRACVSCLRVSCRRANVCGGERGRFICIP